MLIIVLLLFVFFVIGTVFFLQGPPYVPSDDESTKFIVAFVKKYNPKNILDLGSGDGKLIIDLAKNGFQTTGVELNPSLVFRSRRAIKKARLQQKARVTLGNFWTYKTSQYDCIVIYTIKHTIPYLESKLQKELQKGSIIISNYCEFPNLKEIDNKGRVHVYKV